MKKIFVSSTFRDFNVERDAIRNLVMPRLNIIAQKYAENVSFVDLRWGVDTNTLETNEGVRKVLDVCLDEINNCKPYIIVLLGHRYGFLPTDTSLITEATEAKNFSLDNPDISVTELEIEYGALKNLGHTLFYFREIDEDNIPQQERQNYFSDENAHKLKDLKDRIEKFSKENDETGNKAILKGYSLSWDSKSNSLSGNLDNFVDMLVDDIENLMQREWADRATWSEYKIDRHLQWDFAKQKSQQYINHDSLLEKCFTQLEKENILKICGSSGCGKTTLLSRLAVTCKERNFVVLPIFSGLTQRTSTTIDIIRYIIDYINSKFPNRVVNMPDKIEDLIEHFRQAVESWKIEESTGRLVIIIDAVDQLFDDVYKNNLSFIPNNLPDKVQLIFSCLDNFPTVGISTIDVPLLNADNKSEIIEGILNFLGRQLGNSVVRKICEMNASDNPLYLSLLIQRLEMMNYTDFQRIYARTEKLKKQHKPNPEMEAINQIQIDIIENCSENLEDFCVELIKLATQHFGDFIELVVKYIAISRYGLRESDLEGILSSKNVEWNALNFSVFTKYLSNFFIQREDGRIDFAHKNIRLGILKQIGFQNGVRTSSIRLKKIVHGESIQQEKIIFRDLTYDEENFLIEKQLGKNIKNLHDDILNYFGKLEFTDFIRQREIIYHCVKADNKKFFIRYVNEIENQGKENNLQGFFSKWRSYFFGKKFEMEQNDENCGIKEKARKLAFDALNNISMLDNGEWIKGFLKHINFENHNDYSDGDIDCTESEIIALLNFFAKADYSNVSNANGFELGIAVQNANVSLMEVLSQSNFSDELKLLCGDCYYALGYAYLKAAQFGDTEYNQNAVSMFNHCIEFYKKFSDDNFEVKKKLANSYQKLAVSHLGEIQTLSLEYWSEINQAIRLFKEIFDKQDNAENFSSLLNCHTQGAISPLVNDFWSGNILAEDWNKQEIINSISAMENWIESSQNYIEKFQRNNAVINSLYKLYSGMGVLYIYIDASKGLEYTQKSLNFLRANRQYYSLYEFADNEASLFYNFALLNEKLNDIDNAIQSMEDSVEKRIFLLNNGVADQSGQLAWSYLALGRWMTYYEHNFSEGRKYYRKIFEFIPLISDFNVCLVYALLIENLQNEVEDIEKKLESIKDENERTELNILKENLLNKVTDYENLLKTDEGYEEYIDFKENGGEIKKLLFR